MRIAMLLDAWDEVPTGAVVSTSRLSERLRERGHRVAIVTAGAPASDKIALPTLCVPFVQPMITQLRTPVAWPDRGLLAGVIATHDVVHAHLPFLLAARGIGLGEPLSPRLLPSTSRLST
jgi:hypothetical protein